MYIPWNYLDAHTSSENILELQFPDEQQSDDYAIRYLSNCETSMFCDDNECKIAMRVVKSNSVMSRVTKYWRNNPPNKIVLDKFHGMMSEAYRNFSITPGPPRPWPQNVYAVSGKTPVNVLFIYVDALSRRHFHRQMPETVEFLKSSSSYEMYKYHGMGMTTGVNTMSMYMGAPRQRFLTADRVAIWEEFQRNGYVPW